MNNRDSYFNTPTFKYIVEDQTFFVHAGLIERWSQPLYCFISLPMKEREQGFADLKDVAAATFDRFLEWASKGFYTPPEPSLDPRTQGKHTNEDPAGSGRRTASGLRLIADPPGSPIRELEDVYLEHWGALGGLTRKSAKKGKKPFMWDDNDDLPETSASKMRQKLREDFSNRKSTTRKAQNSIPSARKNLNASEDYTDIFLCHAQLYVFAEKYDIKELKSLALKELHAVLAIFDLHVERIGDVGALFRYAYQNVQKFQADQEPLLGMLKDYMGFEMDTLMLDELFRELVKEDINDMLEDYMMQVTMRLKA